MSTMRSLETWRLFLGILLTCVSPLATSGALAQDETPTEPGTPTPTEAAPTEAEADAEPVVLDPAEMESLDAMSLEQLLELDIHVSTASLFEESSLDAGATVDLVTSEDWNRRGARRTLDAIGNQPSMAVYPTQWGGSAVAVRGYASGSSLRGLSVLLDGVPLNDVVFASALNFSSNVELPMLSRIEIVRGPGSAIYGTDAFHGVLGYRSFTSRHDVVEAGAELGTDLYHRGYARVSQAASEAVRVEAALSYSRLPDQDRGYTYTDPSTGTTQHGERALAFRSLHGTASVRITPEGSRWDGSVSFHSNLARAYGAPGPGRTIDERSLLGADDRTSSASQMQLGRAEIGVDLGHGLRAEALGYFWHQDVSMRGGTVVPTLMGPLPARAETSFAEARGGARILLRQEENRAHTRWAVGFESSRMHLYDGGSQTVTDPRYDITLRTSSFLGDPFTRSIQSLFVTAQTRLAGDVLRIHYGGRVDHYSDFGAQVTPRLGFVVAPREGLAFKALYGRAFRAPSVFEMRGDGVDVLYDRSLRPELIDTFELVAMKQTDSLRVQATAFASLWHQGIVLAPIVHPSFTSQYRNVGHNHALGIEASVAYVRDGFRLETSASYVRSRNDDVHADYRAFPQLLGNLGVGYVIAPARLELYLFQRLQVATSEGDPISSARLRSQATLPPFYRVDLHVGWQAIENHLTVFFNLRNAFARTNQVPSLANAEGGAPTQGINASIGVSGSL